MSHKLHLIHEIREIHSIDDAFFNRNMQIKSQKTNGKIFMK